MSSARALRDAMRRLLVAQGALDPVRRPCGEPLDMPHAHALLTLRDATEPVTISTLATDLSIDRSNVSRLCARMASAGELERLPHPEDGRARLLRLTPRGQELAERVDRASATHFRRVLHALGPDAPNVIDALLRLNAALATPTPTDPGGTP